MSSVVLDASALLALLFGEPGAAKVKAALDGSLTSVVNMAEVVTHYAKLGAARQDIEALLRPLPIRLVPLDVALSYDAGMLRPITLEGGLVARRPLLPRPGQARRAIRPYRGAALAAHRRGDGGHGRTDPMRARRVARG